MTTPDPGSPARETSVDLPLCLAAVDDHPYVLKGILWTLRELAPWITVITTAATVTELLGNGGAAADVVLLDLDLGVGQADEESDPTRNVRTILAAGPQVLILTAEVRPVPVRRAIAAGAVGLVLKSDPESQLIQAIRTALTGELAVSSRLAHALLTDPTLVGHLAPPRTTGLRTPRPRSGSARHRQTARPPRGHLHRRHLPQTRRQHLPITGPTHLQRLRNPEARHPGRTRRPRRPRTGQRAPHLNALAKLPGSRRSA